VQAFILFIFSLLFKKKFIVVLVCLIALGAFYLFRENSLKNKAVGRGPMVKTCGAFF